MEILTEGDSFADAIEMARYAIGSAGISLQENECFRSITGSIDGHFIPVKKKLA